MRKRGLISNHYGFTLIEIIAVLIILGILAAVAVPRYLDMTEDAHRKSVEGAMAAAISNYSLAFSDYLLQNETVPTALTDLTIEGDLGDFAATYALAAADDNITITLDTGPTWFADYSGTKTKDIPAGWAPPAAEE